ncbi:MAG: hypothetical protein ILP10_00490, partial [Lachnospiraceae bacterium]|nr:hypothetical protein [Lachnospiraceae bacterium]
NGNWFNYDFENRGTYEYDGTSISFSTESPEGVVEYNGTVYEDKLTMVSHSYINGRISDEEDYIFYPFTEIPDYVP